ncbi:MAG: DUF3581 family protein [Granulosicoccus sp.]|nr:DUF3581 family protein [Granulosicoccus sp.]
MDISQYVTQSDGAVSFTEEQASEFAKGMAGDFNPIHNPESKRFCVPGDLLFSVLLHRYGAAQTTRVQFSGMLDGSTRMLLPDSIDGTETITDVRDRALLSLSLLGDRFTSEPFISSLSEQYVRFSGQTFPDILVPLMKGAGVMINPDRPLVIYKDMAIELDESAAALFERGDNGMLETLHKPLNDELSLKLASTEIDVDGRKGRVRLAFDIAVGGRRIGTGEKNLVLSGLRDYEESAMQQIVDQYNLWRQSYSAIRRAL